MITPSHPSPLYYQIARDVERKILARELRPGDMVPTEGALCEHYGVSRITARKAMEDLVARRLVVRHRGRGTFVAESSYANKLVSQVGSVHDAVSYSEKRTFRLLSRGTVTAPPEVAEALGLAVGDDVHRIVRLGLVRDEPVSITDVYLPLAVAAQLPRGRAITDSESLVRLIEERIGEPFVRIAQTVAPDVATAEVVDLLNVRPRTPVLKVSRTYYVAQGRPMEFAIVHYHPQRYIFNLEIVQG